MAPAKTLLLAALAVPSVAVAETISERRVMEMLFYYDHIYFVPKGNVCGFTIDATNEHHFSFNAQGRILKYKKEGRSDTVYTHRLGTPTQVAMSEGGDAWAEALLKQADDKISWAETSGRDRFVVRRIGANQFEYRNALITDMGLDIRFDASGFLAMRQSLGGKAALVKRKSDTEYELLRGGSAKVGRIEVEERDRRGNPTELAVELNGRSFEVEYEYQYCD